MARGYVEKRNSTVQLAQRVRRLIRPANVQIKAASANMRITRDVRIPMRDGRADSTGRRNTSITEVWCGEAKGREAEWC